MENQCVMCGDKNAIEYSVEDSKGNIKKDFACKKCAKELGLETSEEEEKRNRLWWRNHLKMRMGKEISDEEFEVFYINRTNPKPFKGCDNCSSSDCKKNYPKMTKMEEMIKDHKKYNQEHGSFYDRGHSDCYYSRKRLPHKWVEVKDTNFTYNVVKDIVVLAETDDEIMEYLAGYDFCEKFGERKFGFEMKRTSAKNLYGEYDYKRFDYSKIKLYKSRFQTGIYKTTKK